MALHLLDLPVDRIEAELVAVPYFGDQRPLRGPAALLDWRLDGFLTRQLLSLPPGGGCERYLVQSNHKISADWVMFVGCPQAPSSHPDGVDGVVDALISTLAQAGFTRVGIGLPAETAGDLPLWKQALEQALRRYPVRMECRLSVCDPSVYRN